MLVLFVILLLGSFIGIVGSIYCTIKKNPLWKKFLIAGVVSFVLALVVPGISSSPVQQKQTKEVVLVQQKLEQQQADYNNWYTDMHQKMTFYDNVWKEWHKVFDVLGDGQISRYEA